MDEVQDFVGVRVLPRRRAGEQGSRQHNTLLWAPPPPPESNLNPPSGECLDGSCRNGEGKFEWDRVTCTKVAGMPSFGHMARASTCGTMGNHMMEIGYTGSRRAKVTLCDCGVLSKDGTFHPHTSSLLISLSFSLSFVSLLINH